MTAWSNREDRKAAEGNQSAAGRYDAEKAAGYELLEDEEERQNDIARLQDA